LSFQDWKSQGILLQKTCQNPGLSYNSKKHSVCLSLQVSK